MRLPESQSPHPNTSLAKSFDKVREFFAWVPKAQYILLSSPDELEQEAVEALREELSIPIYSVGPVIPYPQLQSQPRMEADYLNWLDSQEKGSVLYVSLGSFMQVSRSKIEEFATGLRESEVRFLWVAREEAWRVKEISGDRGMVIGWCEQLRVLTHPAVGGFWSHCGWNSTVEGVFAGVPFLTYPLALDQDHNSELVVEGWKIGRKVSGDISGLVREFMDQDNEGSREMRRRAGQLQRICRLAIGRGGSLEANLRSFLNHLFSSSSSSSSLSSLPTSFY